MLDIAAQTQLAQDVCELPDASGGADALRRAPSPFNVLLVVDEEAPSLREHLACIDDVVSLADPEWAADLRSSLLWLEKLDSIGCALQNEFAIIGSSPAMQAVRKSMAHAIADSTAHVLLLGETGTGKRVAAEALHRADAARAPHPFHCLDAGAVVRDLFGSEIFGHLRGAYTGATENRPGALRTAGNGTLLIDEVGELPLGLQAQLLTVLQERQYRPVGSDRTERLQCRIISATNRDIDELVERQAFREDLKFRLAQVTIAMPPLRERQQDIPELVVALIRRLQPESPPEPSPAFLDLLTSWSYPGNVRELESVLRHALVRAHGSRRLRVGHVPGNALQASVSRDRRESRPATSLEPLDVALARARRELVLSALASARHALPMGDRTAHVHWAAQQLKISARSIYNYLSGGIAEEP